MSDTPFTSIDPAVTASQENVEAYFVSGAAPTTTEVLVNAQGRYVRVQLKGYGILSLAEVKVLKLNDTVAPTLSISVDKPLLNKPNHKMNAIEVTLDGNDSGSGVKTIVLTSITSNEDENGLGDGNTSEDIQGAEFGTEDTSFLLRAERSGKGTGRSIRLLIRLQIMLAIPIQYLLQLQCQKVKINLKAFLALTMTRGFRRFEKSD